MRKKNRIVSSFISLGLLLVSLTFLYPLVFMFTNTLRTKYSYYGNQFKFPSLSEITNENYIIMFNQFKILKYFKNSAIITVSSTLLVLIFSIFASYAFAKLEFKGKKILFILIISTLFVPRAISVIPMYMLFSKYGILNTYWSVILANLGGVASSILLMTSSFKSIPDELLSAAKIDGCGYFRIVQHVIIPLGKPIITLTIIFTSVQFWNDLFTPLIFLTKMELRPVTVALASLVQRYGNDPTFQLTGLFLSTIPTVLIYILLQKNIIKGINDGAVKS